MRTVQPRFLFSLATLVTVLALFNMLAQVIGATYPPHPALDDFRQGCDGKPHPCWNGIVPGLTTLDETRRIMAYAGTGVTLFNDLTESYTVYFIPPAPSPVCVVLFQMNKLVVGRVQLQMCKEANVQVGDLTTVLGLPERMVLVSPPNLGYGQVAINILNWRAQFTPDSQVSFINLLQPYSPNRTFYGWHGFVRAWRYCQLEPAYPLCDG
jgi:hypothetical protein